MELSAESVWQDLQEVRRRAPVVHNITNYVAMELSANGLLALGASPVMAHAREELDDILAISQALVINIGTLSPMWIESMRAAMKAARHRGLPIVLDPVGVGASRLRTRTARELIEEVAPTIIRGNASEVIALHADLRTTRGVDSSAAAEEALEAGFQLSRRFECTVSISGEVDHIISGPQQLRVMNGSALMTRVTAMGCTASALTGAFAACVAAPLRAATHAMAVMGVAGELAARRAEGPGSLPAHFLDCLYRLSESELRDTLRLAQGPGREEASRP
ncbi:hydroxyethylthiazole kinase [Myxococcus fulvus]|uniref:hydroxyethylthiazole kinase n=1 Tax=Myxococcus fulvus TaxID=33 RepID=UPI003B98EED9